VTGEGSSPSKREEKRTRIDPPHKKKNIRKGKKQERTTT